MFFKTHAEGKIGYKELTKADLGDSTGNTTHIGLFGDILQFLPNRDYVETSMFIHKDECSPLEFSFDRIENPDGSYRSPKIKKGGKDVASVVTVIRDIYRHYDTTYRWFLMWFGLESEEVVFYLFNDHSADYNDIINFVDLSTSHCRGRLDSSSPNFNDVIHYLENKVNNSNQDFIAELEVASQIDSRDKKYRRFDIDKANKMFKDIGAKGEALIAEYLDRLKFDGQITGFTWYNGSSESGLPYDFTIQELRDNIVYVDVKSTSHKFEQKMIFSGQEIDFITHESNYQIYRVYNMMAEQNHLKICDNSRALAEILNPKLQDFSKELTRHQVELQATKLAIPTIHNILRFGNEINLSIY
ncbi:MAG: DUF3883 domain-containing protein [Rikenellaceae bacterium]